MSIDFQSQVTLTPSMQSLDEVKNDRLDKNVNSFSSISLFAEIAQQRLELSSRYKQLASEHMQVVQDLGSQTNALTALQQCARDGIKVNINLNCDLKTLQANAKRLESQVDDMLQRFENGTNYTKTDKDYGDSIRCDYWAVKYKNPGDPYAYLKTTCQVPADFVDLMKSLNIDTPLEKEHTFVFVDLCGTDDTAPDERYKFNPPRITADQLTTVKVALQNAVLISKHAQVLKDMGFEKVPVFKNDELGNTQKRQFINKVQTKYDEVANRLDTASVYLKDATSQMQANLDKANKSYEKLLELMSSLTKS